jgi:hypothetical protein
MPALADDADNLGSYLSGFNYQTELTSKLDGIGNEDISTPLLHEIVLWKVNRYPRISEDLLIQLNELKNALPKKHRAAEQILIRLMQCAGVDLPMASTLLRFRNPNVFQIIDRHAYRALYGCDYPFYSYSSAKEKAVEYFKYLDALHSLAESKQLQFSDLDRILYVFDKQLNGKL